MADRGSRRDGSARPPAHGAHPAVVFRVAASPRIGFGHLVRALNLARALGVAPRVSIRGTALALETARRLGATVVPGPFRNVVHAGTSLLVIDDPSRRASLPWLRAAQRAGVLVASIHDAGIAPLASDLAIDGSLGARRVSGLGSDAAACRLGPAYAVLSSDLARRPSVRPRPRPAATIVIGLGGGRQALAGQAIARALRSALDRRIALSGARVLLSLGLDRRAKGDDRPLARVTLLPPARFRAALAQATMAVVAGGTTLYEACALGTPVVAVPVVPGQATTIRRFVRAGLAMAAAAPRGSRVGSDRWALAAASAAETLLADSARRDALADRGWRTIDGQGGLRVAQAIGRLLSDGPGGRERDEPETSLKRARVTRR